MPMTADFPSMSSPATLTSTTNQESSSLCKEKRQPCRKPKLEIEVPWEKPPSTPSTQNFNLQTQHLFTRDMLVTEEFIKSELKAMRYIDSSETKLPPMCTSLLKLLPQLGLNRRLLLYYDIFHTWDIDVEISPSTKSYFLS